MSYYDRQRAKLYDKIAKQTQREIQQDIARGKRAYTASRFARSREYQRQYRLRRSGFASSDGSHAATGVDSGDVRGMQELFAALRELNGGIAVRVRRKALQQTAEALAKAAKQSASKFTFNERKEGEDTSAHPAAVLRRAIFRQDPKVRQRYDRKTKKYKRWRPMVYTVRVRVGKKERAGADLGTYESGKNKGKSRGTRKHNRDAYWWHWKEKGTITRRTKRKGGRGKVTGQGVFKSAFDSASPSAIAAGEAAGFAELKKILARQKAKAKTPK